MIIVEITNMVETVAVLTDRTITEWQRRALEHACESTDVNYSLVIVNNHDHPADPDTTLLDHIRNIPAIYDKYGWWPLVELDRRIWQTLAGKTCHSRMTDRHSVESVTVFDEATIIRVEPEVEGAWAELPRLAVDSLEACDVAIRFGFGLLRGAALDAPTKGVLSFHPADIRRYRGQGPEQTFLQGDQTAGTTLQRLSEDIDGGEIVAFGTVDVADAHTLDAIWGRIDARQIELLSEGLKRLQDPTFDPSRVELGPYYSHAERNRISSVIRLLAHNYRGRLRTLSD